jgi:uncharacterized surface protein with fasciclin (FAS1) repeats
MLRTRLLTATAAVALFAAPAAFAQDMTAPPTAPAPTAAPATAPAPTSTPDAAPAPAEATAPAVAQTAAATPAASGTIIDELKANGQFTTLLAALDRAQLTETLKSQPAISIFAPTDAAFARLPEAERARLMDPANVNELRQLLLYHVVVADVNSSQIKGTRGGVETAARTQVQLDGTGDAIKVDDATVTTADIAASNGAVFAIDKVLNPATSEVASGDADEVPAAPMATEAPAAEAPRDGADPDCAGRHPRSGAGRLGARSHAPGRPDPGRGQGPHEDRTGPGSGPHAAGLIPCVRLSLQAAGPRVRRLSFACKDRPCPTPRPNRLPSRT